jgi:hypothetical protein
MKCKSLVEIAELLWALAFSITIALGIRPTPAMAAGGPFAATIANDQSVAQSVVAYGQPPAGFDPVSASDADLDRYGFPPRPDPQNAPGAFTQWQRLVSVPLAPSPQLTQTTIQNGPPQHFTTGQVLSNGNVASTSNNWSGYAVVGPSGTFTSNGSFVFQEWVVPVAQTAFGVCNGVPVYSSQWDGFDGANSSSHDLLQAGSEADAACSGSTKSTLYRAWIEWVPNPEVAVSAPKVNPGDVMGTEVWYTTTSPHGHAMIANYTLNTSATYGFNPPSGTVFIGDSAEWIEERPEENGALSDLTNYVADQFNLDYAYNNSSYFYPGSSPSNTTRYSISMTCPPWNPSSACSSTKVISAPDLYGVDTLWFYDSSPAL